MAKEILSKRKSIAISNGLFLIGIGILYYTETWWPGILLVLWLTLAARQYLSGRKYDFAITSVILIGLFLITFFKIQSAMLIPVLFVTGGIYIIFREYFFAGEPDGEDKSQEMKDDIEK
ncbi:MAG: hypothetical protein WCF65_04150 [Parachlamydiaceae bacterium]